MQQAIYKVPNGKLLKIFLEQETGKITTVKITGDFFIYPEEKIVLLEQALLGEDLSEEKIAEKLKSVVEKENLELFGVDCESIAKVVIMASGS
ncbi:MAG TPA: hypothetical protein DEB09_01815 [Candidatus Magasanikbacteria bacterium]|nr:hypothetical protein [Candidatus Magasanikbacteria bacterium]